MKTSFDQNALRTQVGTQHEQTLSALAQLNLQTRAATQSCDELCSQQSRRASMLPNVEDGDMGLDGDPGAVDARTMRW